MGKEAYERLETSERDSVLQVGTSDWLCWSQKKPTTPGYYWYRSKSYEPYIGYIENPKEGWVTKRVGEWAGPIPEPTTLPKNDPSPMIYLSIFKVNALRSK